MKELSVEEQTQKRLRNRRGTGDVIRPHTYRGGRYRPENARTFTHPQSGKRIWHVARGICRICGAVKAAHFIGVGASGSVLPRPLSAG